MATLGSILAGLMQYIVIMGIFFPLAGGCFNTSTNAITTQCTGPSLQTAILGNVIANTTVALNTSLHNITSTSQSNSLGVAASINNPTFTIGGFLYQGLATFLNTVLNMAKMQLQIWSTTLSLFYGTLPQALVAGTIVLFVVNTISGVLLAYFSGIIVMKIISAIQKVLLEQS